MRQADNDILERLRALSETLGDRVTLLARVHDDVNVFAEGLRDVGLDLHDTAEAALARVADIDATDGVPTSRQTAPNLEVSAALATLANALDQAGATTLAPLPPYETGTTFRDGRQ